MAINRGLDFGTCYSIMSYLDNERMGKDGRVVSYELKDYIPSEMHSPFQDSLVVKRKDGSLEIGALARKYISKSGSKVYKGFKMMLAEKDNSVLESRGYDDVITPEFVVSTYLGSLLKKGIKEEEKINKLVVGVPEIWFSNPKTFDSRTSLENIISGFDFVDKVELVSEPACACAFFVDNYKKNTQKNYKGKILLIDYGGGTLDLALCDVNENGQRSEVRVLHRCGAGLNEEGFVGKAGLAFLEKIVKLALKDLGVPEEELIKQPYFQNCLLETEIFVIEGTDKIRDAFELYAETTNNLETIKDAFATLEDVYVNGENKEFVITYGMLAQAYNEVICPVFNEKMEEMKAYITKKGINTQKDFKIAPVGGFCNFYLTRKQINDFWNVAAGDTRFKDIINDKRDCEKAISYGATLIANDLIGFKQTVPFNLGIMGEQIYWVFRMGEDIAENEAKFASYLDGSGRYYKFGGKQINLAICYNESADPNEDGWIKSGKMKKDILDKLGLEKDKFYNIGFSFDKSTIITLHTIGVERNNSGKWDTSGEERLIRLDNVDGMFEGTYTVDRLN